MLEFNSSEAHELSAGLDPASSGADACSLARPGEEEIHRTWHMGSQKETPSIGKEKLINAWNASVGVSYIEKHGYHRETGTGGTVFQCAVLTGDSIMVHNVPAIKCYLGYADMAPFKTRLQVREGDKTQCHGVRFCNTSLQSNYRL